MQLPADLDSLLDEFWPDALWIAGQRISDEVYTLWILDLDYSYTEWLACLSLDGRWTVSPRGPTLYPSSVGIAEGGLG